MAHRGSGTHLDLAEQSMNSNVVSATQSVSEQDDLASLTAKFKALRRENQQLRGLLKQNELIVQQNIE